MRNSPTSDLYRARFNAAMFAGLNEEWCHKVGRGDCSLTDALGSMDMDDESLPFDEFCDECGNTEFMCSCSDPDDYCDHCIPF